MKRVHVYRDKLAKLIGTYDYKEHSRYMLKLGGSHNNIYSDFYMIIPDNLYIDVYTFTEEEPYINFILGYSEIIYKIEE